MKSLFKFKLIGLSALMLSACGSSSNDSAQNDSTQEDPGVEATQRLVSVSFSRSDGSETVVTSRYLPNGFLASQAITQDGEADYTLTFEHDVDGRFTRAGRDDNQDGIEDRFSTYEYSDSGLKQINRHGEDTLIDNITVFSFENDLAVAREFFSVDNLTNSSQFSEELARLLVRRTYEYENGRQSVSQLDDDADGAVDTRTDYSYNPDGTLSTSTITNIADETTDMESFVYETGPCTNINGNSATEYFCVITN